MRTHNIDDFKNGWFIGNFKPSALKTEEFEVALHEHRAGHEIEPHYHSIATEYNLMAYGVMMVNGQTMGYGSLFILEPGETVYARCVTDCAVVVVKVPSVTNDKNSV